jgi:hypothetical protein
VDPVLILILIRAPRKKQAVGGGVQWGEIDNACSSARGSLAMGVEQHEEKDRKGVRSNRSRKKIVVLTDMVCTLSDPIRATQTFDY